MKLKFLLFLSFIFIGCGGGGGEVYSVNDQQVQTGETVNTNTGDVIIVSGNNSNVTVINVDGGTYVDCGTAENCDVQVGVPTIPSIPN